MSEVMITKNNRFIFVNRSQHFEVLKVALIFQNMFSQTIFTAHHFYITNPINYLTSAIDIIKFNLSKCDYSDHNVKTIIWASAWKEELFKTRPKKKHHLKHNF